MKIDIEVPDSIAEYLRDYWAQEVERVVILLQKAVKDYPDRYYGYGIPIKPTLTMHYEDSFQKAVIAAAEKAGFRVYYTSGGYGNSPHYIAKAE